VAGLARSITVFRRLFLRGDVIASGFCALRQACGQAVQPAKVVTDCAGPPRVAGIYGTTGPSLTAGNARGGFSAIVSAIVGPLFDKSAAD